MKLAIGAIFFFVTIMGVFGIALSLQSSKFGPLYLSLTIPHHSKRKYAWPAFCCVCFGWCACFSLALESLFSNLLDPWAFGLFDGWENIKMTLVLAGSIALTWALLNKLGMAYAYFQKTRSND